MDLTEETFSRYTTIFQYQSADPLAEYKQMAFNLFYLQVIFL
jgi:hypothetical protein